MLAFDGSELSFVYLFGFILGLWYRKHLVAPAAFLVLQSVVVFPLYFANNKQSEIIHIAHGISVWAGSITGVFLSHLTSGPKLIRRRAFDKRTFFHVGLALTLVLTPWPFLVLRVYLQPQFSLIPSVAITLVVYVAVWRVWMRQSMFDYFPSVRKMRQFVASACAVHVYVLLAFAGVDVLFQDCTLGFALRIAVVTVCTLAIAMARLLAWHRASSTNAAAQRNRQAYILQSYWGEALEESLSTSSSSSEGLFKDDFYIESV